MQRWFEEFSDAQRTAAVQCVEPLLGASQLHLLASRLPNEDLHAFCAPGCDDVFRALPLHIIYKIFKFLGPTSLVQASSKAISIAFVVLLLVYLLIWVTYVLSSYRLF